MEYLIGLLLGVLLGISGTGGSLFAVPLLVLLLKIPINEAMSVALGAVTLSAVCGAVSRRREVLFIPGLLLGGAGVLSAPLGRALSVYIEEIWLMTGFTCLAFISAISLWRKSAYIATPTRPLFLCDETQRMVSAGLAIGFLSGMFGVGGGMLVVPFLQRLAVYNMPSILATSLLVITLISGAGFATGLVVHHQLDITLLAKLSVAGILGTLIAQRFSRMLPQTHLPKLIATLLVGVSLLSLGISHH